MASLIRGVPPVIQQPVNQAAATSHSTLITPQHVHFPLQVPRRKSHSKNILVFLTKYQYIYENYRAIKKRHIPVTALAKNLNADMKPLYKTIKSCTYKIEAVVSGRMLVRSLGFTKKGTMAYVVQPCN